MASESDLHALPDSEPSQSNLPETSPGSLIHAPSGLYDATDDLKALAAFLNSGKRLWLPQQHQRALQETLAYLSTSSESSLNILTPNHTPQSTSTSSSPSVSNPKSSQSLDFSYNPVVRTYVKLNRQTILEKVIYHLPGVLVEYPETSMHGSIGHVFSMDDASQWINPAHNFAYSQGAPNGSSGAKAVYCALLTDEDGNEVPCKVSHSTCELFFLP